MDAANLSMDSVEGVLAIESRFRRRMFRAVLAATLGVHALYLLVLNERSPAQAWTAFVLGAAVGVAVESGGPRLWRRGYPMRHQLGVSLLGILYTLFLGVQVALTGAAAQAHVTWWMSVYPIYVILAGSVGTGVVLLAGTLLWFVAVHVAVDQGWWVAAPPDASPVAALAGVVGSTALLGVFLAFSVQRRLALRDALLAAIARLATEREQARAETNAKDLLLANTTHELRTPLNAVIGLAELLATARLSPAQERELLGQMRQSAAMLRELVDDVLDYAKLEAGKLNVEPIEFPLRSTVFGIAHLFAPQAHAKGLEIGVCLTPDTPHRVLGDAQRLRQILANFVANAIKFTEQGGVQLCIETRPGDRVRIEVHDSGIGIAEADLAGLFRPFVQAGSGTARRFGGTGLGLSISRQLAERMGGRVGVRSTMGQGSVFWVELPLPARPGDSPYAYPALPPMGALCLVTANRFLHWTVSDMLKARGLAVQLLPHLDDPALQALPPRSVVMVDAQALVDARAARRMAALARQLRGLGTLPVLLGSTVSSEVPASITGAVVTLYKPVRLSRLLAALVQALEPLPDSPPDGDAVQALQPRPLRGLHVLLADDNPINQLVASSMLEHLGATVQAVDDGQGTLDALAQGRYDIVLLDCEMPGLDGPEVARRWRQTEAREGRRHTPVVAVTGHSRQDAWPRCQAAGMDEFLSKPYFSDQLAALILGVLALTEAEGDRR